jgi:hypothetical protein
MWRRPRTPTIGSLATLVVCSSSVANATPARPFPHRYSFITVHCRLSAPPRLEMRVTPLQSEQSALKIGRKLCVCARFSHVLHATDPQPYRTADACRIASRELLEIHLTRSQQTRKLFLIASLSGLLAHSWHPATHQAFVAIHAFLIHKSRVGNLNSRYNRAFLRAAAQSNQEPRSAAGLRHPARHETGFGLRSSNIAALILRTTKDNA